MEDVLSSVKTLTIAELREQLINRGHKIGPVTATTKILFQKKLANLIYKEKYGDVSGNDVQIESKSSETKQVPEKANDINIIKDDVPCIYYGILLASEEATKMHNLPDEKLVFAEKMAAFAVAKEHPGSRFKAFKTFDEALQFVKKSENQNCNKSLISQINEPTSTEVNVVEKSLYKAPKMRDLVTLRNIIESGDENQFTSVVWSNPRYLVSSGDTPVILHEGQRYNALHTAAKANRPEMCRRILETILDPEFSKQLYQGTSDCEETQARRVQFLADLYLNMPDRGNGESPLHFASKFGFPDVVEVLVGYPATDRNMKNRYGETAHDVACSRCQLPSENVKNKIIELLQGLCFVPLLRAEDNTASPVIGQPWSPDKTVSPGMHLGKSPIDPQLAVRARAGPMSPSKAKMFYQQWSSPLSHSPINKRKMIASIKREDGDKGLERIGRQLAREMHIPWLEYWEFLDAFVDLATESGISELEKHLKKQQSALTFTQCLQNIQPQDIVQTSGFCPPIDLSSSFLGQQKKNLIQTSSLSASGGIHLQKSGGESINTTDGHDDGDERGNVCGDADGTKVDLVCSGSVKNKMEFCQLGDSELPNNLTSTPKTDRWTYRQHHASTEQDYSPASKSDCDVSAGGEPIENESICKISHIRASKLDISEGKSENSHTDEVSKQTDEAGLKGNNSKPFNSGDLIDQERQVMLNPNTKEKEKIYNNAEVISQQREVTLTPNTWAYRCQEHKTCDMGDRSPTKSDVSNSGETSDLSVSNNDEDIILASLSKLKLSNSGEATAPFVTESDRNESSVFSTPKPAEVSFNTNLSNLCADFEDKLMFTPQHSSFCSAMPFGQITLNLGKSHHAAEAFRRLSDLKLSEEEEVVEDMLSHNAPVIVLINNNVQVCDSEHCEIVVDVWVTKDEDLKSSVNNVFPDIVVSLQNKETLDRLLQVESPQLVNVDVTCEEKYTLRQHTIPVQALFVKNNHESNFNVHILGLRHSKSDLDVFRAVRNTVVDVQRFPLTHRWMQRMTVLTSDNKQSWPSPSRLRSEARLSRNTSCLSPLVTGSPSFRSRRPVYSPTVVENTPRTVLFPQSPKPTV